MKVLIIFNHGLGDAVQFTSVLQHLKKYKPEWEISLLAKRGKHSAALGYCEQIWHDQEPAPDQAAFEKVFDLGWWENSNRYGDCPNTKVTNCLREVFNIEPDPELLNYKVNVTDDSLRRTEQYLKSIGAKKGDNGRYKVVMMHYEGNTSTNKKNVAHEVASAACELATDLGYIPVILDWDKRSPLPDNKRIFNPGVHAKDIWGGFGSGDAETLTALISQVSLFIGIDSGPQKCAGATQTPSIGLWHAHSPVQFMDLCTNHVHLVPDSFHLSLIHI